MRMGAYAMVGAGEVCTYDKDKSGYFSRVSNNPVSCFMVT